MLSGMTASPRAVELALLAATAAADKKAENIVAIDVSEQLAITDIFLLCSANSDRQVRAVVDAVEEALDAIDVDPVRREGERSGRWVLLDYVDFVVHVQHTEERAFYGLERLWKDCPVIPLPELVVDGEARPRAELPADADELADDDLADDDLADDDLAEADLADDDLAGADDEALGE